MIKRHLMNLASALLLLVLIIGLLSCGEDPDNIIGSSEHNIQLEQPYTPSILADGLSTMDIWATVLNKDGNAARGMKVVFETSHGSISQFAYTDDYGNCKAILTSTASETDLIAEVKATVVDTAFNSLGKKVIEDVSLKLSTTKNGQSANRRLAKTANSDATLEIKFLGITLSAQAKDLVLPADGISQTLLSLNLFETTSRKPIKGEELFISASSRNMSASTFTDQNGTAQVAITSGESPAIDTLTVSFGNLLTRRIQLEYVEPKLSLESNVTELIADGKSMATVTATLLSQKNTPIMGANIGFSSTAGIIEPLGKTDNMGKANVRLIAGKDENSSVFVIAEFLALRDTIQVAFVKSSAENLKFYPDNEEPLLRDGTSEVGIQIKATDAANNPQANTIINLEAEYGTVPDTVMTNELGLARLTYTSDAGKSSVTDQIKASVGGKTWTTDILLYGLNVSVTALPDSLPADGAAVSQVNLVLRRAGTNVPITSYEIQLGASLGYVPASVVTDNHGQASFSFTAGDEAGTAEVQLYLGEIQEKLSIHLYKNFSTNLTLSSSNSFIWVRETGQVEETDIMATVLGVNGNPVSETHTVEFSITASPGGGEFLETPSGSAGQVVAVSTVNGTAKAYLRSGTKSGQVQIRARITDMPEVAAQSTKLVIRSGPPYMWIDPADPNNVVHHANVLVESGKHNTSFVNPLQEIEVTALFTDKYNNPVEKNTAVYFTTSGGSITSDALTDDLGKTTVTLQNSNPFPVIVSQDPGQLTGFHFPNPNDETVMMNLILPDYEGSEIVNSAGNMGPNDGIATIMAVTTGQDQFGNTVDVWATTQVIFSQALYRFTAEIDKDSVRVGERANIVIRCYDVNGNPVAAGSNLRVSTDAGKITASDLMPPAERYGYGSTYFVTQIINTLNPEEDKTKPANIEIELTSPNGDATIGLGVILVVD